MKQIHNIQKSIGKSIPPLWIFKIPRKKMREAEIYRFLPNLCDLHSKVHRLAYRFQNLWKIHRLAYGFFFFVNSTSGLLCEPTRPRMSSSVPATACISQYLHVLSSWQEGKHSWCCFSRQSSMMKIKRSKWLSVLRKYLITIAIPWYKIEPIPASKLGDQTKKLWRLDKMFSCLGLFSPSSETLLYERQLGKHYRQIG